MMASPSNLATWFWRHTPTPVTSANVNPVFLSNNNPIPQSNGLVLSIAAVMRSVYASSGEAKLAALFKCAQEMVPLRNYLNKMWWKQLRSPIQVDNSTAAGYTNNTIIARRIKSLKMRLNWLKCRELQDQFRIFWDKGSHNWADYHTKHHLPEYHIAHCHSHAGWIKQLHTPQANTRVFPIPFFHFF
jgi:hypothetical protein